MVLHLPNAYAHVHMPLIAADATTEPGAPGGTNIAAGEYGYDLWYFRWMLEAGAVDVQ